MVLSRSSSRLRGSPPLSFLPPPHLCHPLTPHGYARLGLAGARSAAPELRVRQRRGHQRAVKEGHGDPRLRLDDVARQHFGDVTYASYDKFIKSIASRLGLDPAAHTSHSGRRSAASRMAAAGMTSEIKAAGRWNSDAWEGYIEQCVQLCEGKSDKLLAPFLFVKCN